MCPITVLKLLYNSCFIIVAVVTVEGVVCYLNSSHAKACGRLFSASDSIQYSK